MSEHTDGQAVSGFAAVMVRQLKRNSDKGHWGNRHNRELFDKLKAELHELEKALINNHDIIGEAADVANYAMMIADNDMRKD